MNLIGLDLNNFRAFPSASISFVPDGLTLIAGPNNSGKSALLSAVDFLRSLANDDGAIHAGADQLAITATFALRERERTFLLDNLGATTGLTEWLATPVFSLVQWRYYLVRGRGGLIGGLLSATNADNSLQPILSKESAQSANYSVVNVTKQLAAGASTGPFPGAEEISSGRNYLDPFGQFGSYAPFATLLQRWAEDVYHFLPLRTGTQRQLGISSVERLAPDGSNLGHALLNMKTNDDEGWVRLTEIMQELVPEVGKLQVNTDANVRVEFLESTGHRHNLKDLGTGVEQLLMTAYVGVRHPRGGLLIIEEPETNLHPEAQRGLLARLQSWSQDLQIMATTHSTVFLDRASGAKSEIWLVKRDNGQSTVQRADATLLEVFRALGVRPAHILSAEGVLLVEGDTDASVLEIWFGPELRRHRIAIIAARGSDRAWNAEELVTWVDEATTLKIPTVFIRDRDELPQDVIKKLEAGPVRVLKQRELENYLLQPPEVGRVLRARLQEAGKDASQWPDERVAAELRTSADAVKMIVVLKRVAGRLAPIRPLDRKDVMGLIEAGISRAAALKRIEEKVQPIPALEVEKAWDEEEARVNAAWDAGWASLAAGSDVLEVLWNRAGLKYAKTRDTVLLASAVSPAPEEIRGIVNDLVGQVDHALHG